MTVFDKDGTQDMYLVCPECGESGVVYYTTKPPTYCSDVCKAKAYRQRKRDKTKNENRHVSNKTKQQIERHLDQTLHLMACDCGRGIWTVRGNVQIGALLCGLCNSEFRRK